MSNIPASNDKYVATWLFTCCFFILMMVAIGGLTRLTESGLSITEWKPVSGIMPPFSEHAWQEEFTKYQQSPEYLKKNLGMSLEEFKGIFWLEFIHRLVGRITGMVFLLPFLYFFIKKQIDKPLSLRLIGIFALGGMQGVVGWYMVKSGLKDAPHVSHLWLAFHLGMAVIIYGMVLWEGLGAKEGWKREESSSLRGVKRSDSDKATQTSLTIKRKWIAASATPPRNDKLLFPLSPFPLAITLLALIFIQIIFGAFVAGMHAGLMYNTFPDMDGSFIPGGMFVMSPWYINFLENATTIQFTHRMLAYTITILIFIFWWLSRNFTLTNSTIRAINLLPVVVLIQILLGVLTLLHHVPVFLASLHQIVALALFTVAIIVVYEIKVTGIWCQKTVATY